MKSLKAYGHELIDEIVALGYERDGVYRRLAKELNYPKAWGSHFSQMNTEEELERAIKKLLKIKRKAVRRHERVMAARVYKQNLEKIREVGKQNEKRRKWWWRVINIAR